MNWAVLGPWLFAFSSLVVAVLWFVASWRAVDSSWFDDLSLWLRAPLWLIVGIPYVCIVGVAYALDAPDWLRGALFLALSAAPSAAAGVALYYSDGFVILASLGWWLVLLALLAVAWGITGWLLVSSRWFDDAPPFFQLPLHSLFFPPVLIISMFGWIWLLLSFARRRLGAPFASRLRRQSRAALLEELRDARDLLNRAAARQCHRVGQLASERDELRVQVALLTAELLEVRTELSKAQDEARNAKPEDVREFILKCRGEMEQVCDSLVVATQAFIRLYQDAARPVASMEELHQRIRSMAETLGILEAEEAPDTFASYFPEDPAEFFASSDEKAVRCLYRKLALSGHPDVVIGKYGEIPWMRRLAEDFMTILNDRKAAI